MTTGTTAAPGYWWNGWIDVVYEPYTPCCLGHEEASPEVDDDVELDSPSWHNDALAELESRNFERVNMPKRLRTNDARRSG